MNQVAGSVATQVLALLPCKLEQIEPQLLCNLLHTSRSLHDQLQQPRSCKQLVVSLKEQPNVSIATRFACWLGSYGHMLEALEIRVECGADGEHSPPLGECISAGLRSLHEPTLRALAVFGGDWCELELTPTLFKSPGLQGLEELHLCRTDAMSTLHISQLTRLTNLGLGYTEKDGGDLRGLYCNVDDGVDVAPQWPVSLRRLRALDIGSWQADKLKVAFSHLTSLTSFSYRPYCEDWANIDVFPELPVAPGMLELELGGFEGMHSVISDRVPGLTKLALLCDFAPEDDSRYGYTRIFEGLKDLRHLEIESESCCFTAATSLKVLCWEQGPASIAEVARLSCLTSLTDLTITIGTFEGQQAVDLCGAVMDLCSTLSRLVHLKMQNLFREAANLDRQQRTVLCWCLAPLTAASVFPQLQKVTVPRGWLTANNATGGHGADSATAGAQSADADGSSAGQQLLAQLRKRRPQLEVILKRL